MKLLPLILSCFLLFFPFESSYGQSSEPPILFIYDASGSMWGKLTNSTKKEVAADVLVQTIDALDTDQKIGFMAYGHRSKGDCEDVELLADLTNSDKSLLKSEVRKLNPLGKTPLAYSATLAIDAIKRSKTKATIILITDGIESCGGNLCEVIRMAREAGIEFKLHIVGFGLKDDETEALKCAAKEGNGNYYDAKDADQLAEVMDEAVHQKIDDPVANHTFYATKNGEPVDAYIKIVNKETGKDIRGSRTYKDTAHVHIPIGTYELSVRPLAGSDIAGKTIELTKTEEGTSHTDISFDGGKIEVLVTNNGEGWDATVRVIDQATQKTVAQTRTYKKSPFLEVNTGHYDVVVNPLGIKGSSLKYTFENILVAANESNAISYDYKTGELFVGVSTSSGELVDATVNVTDLNTNKNVAASRTYTSESSNPRKFILLPGNYKVVIKPLGKHKGASQTHELDVFAGQSTTKSIKVN
ncbi:MAG: VWA domain-containing protein [Bacteroidota bacterium]